MSDIESSVRRSKTIFVTFSHITVWHNLLVVFFQYLSIVLLHLDLQIFPCFRLRRSLGPSTSRNEAVLDLDSIIWIGNIVVRHVYIVVILTIRVHVS